MMGKIAEATAGLGPAPWADDVEAWLEASNVAEIADDIDRYALAEVSKAVAAERERCCRVVAVQAGSDDIARRTILAIRSGDDFYDVDDPVLKQC